MIQLALSLGHLYNYFSTKKGGQVTNPIIATCGKEGEQDREDKEDREDRKRQRLEDKNDRRQRRHGRQDIL